MAAPIHHGVRRTVVDRVLTGHFAEIVDAPEDGLGGTRIVERLIAVTDGLRRAARVGHGHSRKAGEGHCDKTRGPCEPTIRSAMIRHDFYPLVDATGDGYPWVCVCS